MRRLALIAGFAALCTGALASDRIEWHSHLAPRQPGETARVALTFDLCDGGFDRRIFDILVMRHIPATLFVTGLWLARNPEAIALLRAYPDLFELENHGARHVPAVLGDAPVYGLRPAGTRAAIAAEIAGGAQSLTQATGIVPRFYRDATAVYSRSIPAEIETLGYRVAGFSLNADEGASLGAQQAAAALLGATDGDIIIAHMNQPDREAGLGVAMGITALADEGMNFVRLDDVAWR